LDPEGFLEPFDLLADGRLVAPHRLFGARHAAGSRDKVETPEPLEKIPTEFVDHSPSSHPLNTFAKKDVRSRANAPNMTFNNANINQAFPHLYKYF
jgi:hypothetical protein